MEKFHQKNITKKISPKKFSPKKFSKKIIQKNFREIVFKFFLAIVVPQPIWGMPAKFWGV
jgi:hypothetical protein